MPTADGRTNALTTATVAGDTAKPTVSTTAKINGTGTAMTFTFSEPVKRVDAFVDGDIQISGVDNAANLTVATKLGSTAVNAAGTEITAVGANDIFDSMTITKATAFSVGTTVKFKAGAVQDLNANTNTAGSGVVSSDTTVPTIVGNPTVVQSVGDAATYVLDGKVLLTLKSATLGSQGNDYDVLWAAAANNAASTEACTAAGENITLVFTTANNSANTTSTAATMAATINASATCSAIVTASVEGLGGALTAAISAAAQGAGNAASFGGGTHVMTVTTTFSEAILKSSVAAAGIQYDGDGANGAVANNTTTKLSVVGAVVTTSHSISSDAQVFVPGTSTIDYANTTTDLVGNAMAAVANKAALVG